MTSSIPWKPGEIPVVNVVCTNGSLHFTNPNKSCKDKAWKYLDTKSNGFLINKIDPSLVDSRVRMISNVSVTMSQYTV